MPREKEITAFYYFFIFSLVICCIQKKNTILWSTKQPDNCDVFSTVMLTKYNVSLLFCMYEPHESTCDVMYCRERRHLYYGGQI
jgi:hypothetical protein